MHDLRRNVAIDLVVAVGIAVTSAIVNALLPTIARQTGMAPIGIAVLAAAPYVGNLLGAFAGRIGPQSRPQLALTRALGAGLLLSLAFAPDPLLIVIVVLFFWLSLSLSNPFHFGLWSSMYELEDTRDPRVVYGFSVAGAHQIPKPLVRSLLALAARR